jgi:hypothetical protein
MSGFAVGGLIVTMVITVRLAVSVIATMGFMQDFHLFEFVALARNESE